MSFRGFLVTLVVLFAVGMAVLLLLVVPAVQGE